MFNLFKPSKKSTNDLIEEIHETFYTEVDRILASALVANSLDTDKNELIEKCNKLKSLGFLSAREVKEAEGEIERLEKLKSDNEAKKTLIEAINHFSFKYPNYKFITEESVKKICEKYNLVYGEIGRYTGAVPDKNMKQMEDFKISEDDECCIEEDLVFNQWRGGYSSLRRKFKSFTCLKKEKEAYRNNAIEYITTDRRIERLNMKCPLEIAAPLKDFNIIGMEVKDSKLSKIEIPDPVVLKPVIFNEQKYYLIVTAWGIESTDEMVVNQKMN